MFPDDGADAETIMKNAGAALFRAKRKGGGGYEFYSTDMNAEAVKRLALETDLRRAIANQEFVTYYQPVIDFTSGEVIGLEALVRWQHPKLGILAPAEFIDIAEDTGMIWHRDRFRNGPLKLGRAAPSSGLTYSHQVSARVHPERKIFRSHRQILGQALSTLKAGLEITNVDMAREPPLTCS